MMRGHVNLDHGSDVVHLNFGKQKTWGGEGKRKKGGLERGLFNLLKPWKAFKRKYTYR